MVIIYRNLSDVHIYLIWHASKANSRILRKAKTFKVFLEKYIVYVCCKNAQIVMTYHLCNNVQLNLANSCVVPHSSLVYRSSRYKEELQGLYSGHISIYGFSCIRIYFINGGDYHYTGVRVDGEPCRPAIQAKRETKKKNHLRQR